MLDLGVHTVTTSFEHRSELFQTSLEGAWPTNNRLSLWTTWNDDTRISGVFLCVCRPAPIDLSIWTTNVATIPPPSSWPILPRALEDSDIWNLHESNIGSYPHHFGMSWRLFGHVTRPGSSIIYDAYG